MKKPISFLIFKIVGFVALAIAIWGAVLAFSGFDDFESNNFMIGGFMATFGLFAAIACLVKGFSPEITKQSLKTQGYIMQENKEELSNIATTTAEIASDAVTVTTKAVKEGFLDEQMYCKHCGAQIDADSKFCKSCGKEQ